MIIYKIITIVIWFILSLIAWGLIETYIWDKIQEIAKQYGLFIDDDQIDTAKESGIFWTAMIVSVIIGILIGSLK